MPTRKKSGAAPSSSSEKVEISIVTSDEEEVVVDPLAGARRSAREKRPPDENVLLEFKSRPDAKYPLRITYGNLRRLRQSTGKVSVPETLLLKDEVVNFYCKYLQDGPPKEPSHCARLLPGLDAMTRKRVHIFDTYFLTKLRDLLSKKKDLSRLLRWVGDVDLFDKDFLFVPVHEPRMSGHWCLAVVCFPGLAVKRATDSATGGGGAAEVKAEVKAEADEEAGASANADADAHHASAKKEAPAQEPHPDAKVAASMEREPKEEVPAPGMHAALEAAPRDCSSYRPPVAAAPVEASSASTSTTTAVKSDESGASSSSAPLAHAPCILFLDSFLTNATKKLFSELRQFLEFYWRRRHREQAVDGHKESGQMSEPPPPTDEFGVRQQPPTKKRPAKASAALGPSRKSVRRAADGGDGDGSDDGLEEVDADGVAVPRASKRSRTSASTDVDAADDDAPAAGGAGGRPRRRAAVQGELNLERTKALEERGRLLDAAEDGQKAGRAACRPHKRRTQEERDIAAATQASLSEPPPASVLGVVEDGEEEGAAAGEDGGDGAALPTPVEKQPAKKKQKAAATASPELPPGWTFEQRQGPKREYKVFYSADHKLRAESMAAAWRAYEKEREQVAAGAASVSSEAVVAAAPPGPSEDAEPGTPPAEFGCLYALSSVVGTSTGTPADAQSPPIPAQCPMAAGVTAEAEEDDDYDVVDAAVDDESDGAAADVEGLADVPPPPVATAEEPPSAAPQGNGELAVAAEAETANTTGGVADAAGARSRRRSGRATAAAVTADVPANATGEVGGEVGGETGGAAGGVAGADDDAAGGGSKAAAAPGSDLPKPEWFSTARVPHLVLKRAPQQQNEYDCGVYMLHFIEILSRFTAEGTLPSFAVADDVIDHFHEKLFKKEEIDRKRDALHRCITALARAAGTDVHPDDDDDDDSRMARRV